MSGGMEKMVMHDSRRCRALARECLLATREPCDRYSRKLNFSMAALWLSFARQDEAVADLLGRWGADKPEAFDGDFTSVTRKREASMDGGCGNATKIKRSKDFRFVCWCGLNHSLRDSERD
jgi:hypothetical protein